VRPPRVTEPAAPARGRGKPLNPMSAKRIATLGTIVVVLLGILVVRLWFLQVVGARSFEAQAVGNSVRSINIPAPRGEILDRNGVPLAGSRLAWDIVALPQDLDGEQGDRTLRKIARVLGEPPAKLRRLMASGKKRAPYKSVVLQADIDDSLRIPLNERIREFAGIRLERNFRRDYPLGAAVSQVVGFVGPITEAEIDEKRRQGYRNDAIVGRDGLELRYEEFLKGADGERRVEVDAAGQPVGRGTLSERPARAGLNLQTTIDVNVQKALYSALREQVELKAERTAGAGGVVLDATTGEVIALASYPGYDPRRYNRSQRNRRKIYNRALQGYPPGSTFKPVTAVAALNSGIITPDKFLSSPKTVVLFRTPFNNFRKKSLPDMQIRRAIAMSSDTFFYQVGASIWKRSPLQAQKDGDNKLRYWADQLGLGRRTGIDIPGEQSGVLPDRAWKVKNLSPKYGRLWDRWLPGDTINMSVGQGLLAASPLQMARAYAALLNGGRVLTPTVGSATLDPNSGRMVSDLMKGREEGHTAAFNPRVLETVLGGMHDVTSTNDGTAVPVFGALGGLVSGKTGTAENRPRRDHAWFVGYGPANAGAAPKYVVAVVVENAGLGAAAAAPVACRTLAAAIGYDAGRCGKGNVQTASAD